MVIPLRFEKLGLLTFGLLFFMVFCITNLTVPPSSSSLSIAEVTICWQDLGFHDWFLIEESSWLVHSCVNLSFLEVLVSYLSFPSAFCIPWAILHLVFNLICKPIISGEAILGPLVFYLLIHSYLETFGQYSFISLLKQELLILSRSLLD